MSYDICGDNRFELIEKYKKKLIESTNIEDSPEEMKVLNDIFFRLWQMGWLDRLEKKGEEIDRLREMLAKKGEWVSVTERLPEYNGITEEVLITTSDGDIDIGGMGRLGWWRCEANEGFEWINDVIAWQPLPQPYKAESENKE